MLQYRGTTEAGRRDVGRGLRFAQDAFEWTREAVDRFVLTVDERAGDLIELTRITTDGSFTLSTDSGDPPALRFDGGLDIDLGDAISIDLPAWLGGTYTADHLIGLVDMDAHGVMDGDQLLVTGDLAVLGGILTLDSTTELDWDRGQVSISGDLDILDGFITTTSGFKVGGNLDFMLSGGASVSIPNGSPWFAGATLGSGQYMVSYTNDLNLSNDFVAGWGSFGPVDLGIRFWLNGNVDLLGAQEIDSLAQEQSASPAGPMVSLSAAAAPLSVETLGDVQPLNATPQSESFAIDAGTNWALFLAEWDNATPGVTMSLQTPDGTFDEAAIDADPNMQIVTELGSDHRRAIRVDTPQAGTWTVTVDDTANLGTVDIMAMVDALLPTMSITGANGGELRSPVEID